MVKNDELFRKVRKFSRDLHMMFFNSASPPDSRESMMRHPHRGGYGRPDHTHMDREAHPDFGKGMRRRRMSRERFLVIISEYPDGVRQKELAEKAGVNASSTSEVVGRLEDDGYIVRTIDESDKRATILKLTEMGKVRAEEIRSERETFLDKMFSKITEEEKQALSDILDKLIS